MLIDRFNNQYRRQKFTYNLINVKQSLINKFYIIIYGFAYSNYSYVNNTFLKYMITLQEFL